MNLVDATLHEIERVSQLIPLYDAALNGGIASSMMRMDIHVAHDALLDGDPVKIMNAYTALTEWKE